jgi:hypothetical protein
VNVTVPATRPTVPETASPTAVTVSGSPSTSVSLTSSAAAVTVAAVSSLAATAALAATGASLSGVTVIEIVADTVNSPSSTVTRTASAPW